MSKGTKKAGITGKYGPRYGVKIRKQIKSVSRHRAKPQTCPECQANAVKRVASGIWLCNHCGLKFAASAYSTRTRSYRREEAKTQDAIYQREDLADMQEEMGETVEAETAEDLQKTPEPIVPKDEIPEEILEEAEVELEEDPEE